MTQLEFPTTDVLMRAIFPPIKGKKKTAKQEKVIAVKQQRSSARQRVLELLQDGKKHTLKELHNASRCSETAASARFRQLRKMGYPVHSKEVGDSWLYWMETE